jgi:hypothetical protein
MARAGITQKAMSVFSERAKDGQNEKASEQKTEEKNRDLEEAKTKS